MENRKAYGVIGRRALPDLKKTAWQEVLDHLDGALTEGVHYKVNLSSMTITFWNGSKIVCATWADKRYRKFRSWKISFLLIEEAVENTEDDFEAFKQLKARLRRVPSVQQNIMLVITNPDAPGHWVHDYFIESQPHANRFVFYSRMTDNIFLDPAYVRQLKEDFNEKEWLRYGEGQWIELIGEVIYWAYDSDVNFLRDTEYIPNPQYPLGITFDFNIALGKPISAIMFQQIGDVFHFFRPKAVHGGRTEDVLHEWHQDGAFPDGFKYEICGDASGKHKDTRSNRSDYDIIMQKMNEFNLPFDYIVPIKNPEIRHRHNRVNAYCKNANGTHRLFLYKGCEFADKGMRLTSLKKGASFIEDDSKEYQHITTAIGYAVCAKLLFGESKKLKTRQL